MQVTEWDHRLAVRADGRNLMGHAGVVLLRKVADRVGLATGLSVALPKGTGPGWRDRGVTLVQLACAIVLGATNILQAEQLHTTGVRCSPGRSRTAPCAAPWPRSTPRSRPGWNAPAPRYAARCGRCSPCAPGGLPLDPGVRTELTGWYVLDLDATIVPCSSRKEGAAGSFKGSFGHWVRGWPTPASASRCCCGPVTRRPTTSPPTRRS